MFYSPWKSSKRMAVVVEVVVESGKMRDAFLRFKEWFHSDRHGQGPFWGPGASSLKPQAPPLTGCTQEPQTLSAGFCL